MILSAGDKITYEEETAKETSFAFCSLIDYLTLLPIKEALSFQGKSSLTIISLHSTQTYKRQSFMLRGDQQIL